MSWPDYYDWLYQHPPANRDDVVVGNTRARVAPLARWLLLRWSAIENENSSLSRALRGAGWHPSPGPSNSDYSLSLSALTPAGEVRRGVPEEAADEARGAAAGRRFFQACTADYIEKIVLFLDNLRRYVFPSRTIAALGPAGRTQFQITASHWHQINTIPWGSDIGLPYGPAPRAPSYGNHRQRVNGMYQLLLWKQRNPTGDPSSTMCRQAGIHYPHWLLDRSVGPTVQPWF